MQYATAVLRKWQNSRAASSGRYLLQQKVQKINKKS